MNEAMSEARDFLSSADFLFLTFGLSLLPLPLTRPPLSPPSEAAYVGSLCHACATVGSPDKTPLGLNFFC
eukprot:820720-Rhodomonas_salina.2